MLDFMGPIFSTMLFFIIFGFILSRVLKRNDIVDTLWGLGFAVLALTNAYQTTNLTFRAKIVLFLLLLWSARIALYIGSRNLSKSEDARYANWRKEWGTTEPLRAFLQIFLLQGLIMIVVALPVVFSIRAEYKPLTPFDFAGVGLFLIGFLFEAISDWQLSQFKKNPQNKGKIFNQGLWSFSRHPNYFGEILIWWGFFLLAASVDKGYFTIISPLTITYLLLKVSGIPMLDKLLKERGDAFKNYVEQTPSILPFKLKEIWVYLAVIVTLLSLDFTWLGIVMNSFYLEQTKSIARINNGQWDTLPWAALFVYLFLALGVRFFSIKKQQNYLSALFSGGIFGLCTYALYEFTNLALVRNWPLEMALIDFIWGVVLCGAAALVGQLVMNRIYRESP